MNRRQTFAKLIGVLRRLAARLRGRGGGATGGIISNNGAS